MKFAAIVVTTLVAVAAANEYQPALRALAAPEPASEHAHLPTTPNASGDTAVKEPAKDKKKKEWFGGFGWGGPWGGWGSCGGCGGWGGWGGIGGWGGVGGWGW
ncbi:hypothetical protein DVH05_014294 [Phytophthora capsici]|nr:hypothetical protein DVH05_014294 [Phytophthora capsici]|eukprot:jgi/Phyca11/503894/fgenesh2_kg.PHYCAscaffold_5_\